MAEDRMIEFVAMDGRKFSIAASTTVEELVRDMRFGPIRLVAKDEPIKGDEFRCTE